MKKFNLNSKLVGHKKKIIHSLKTYKNISIGSTNYKLNMFVNNKYIINKNLKFNSKVSNNIYNNVFYSYKKNK
ncbi:hypothetical protein MACJ_004179 (apicoplast) [Theileria orientalis]|uniref:Uncharacterized protein n=1 Tax=Theileria orientalis TaxID=68886 RepID=A0A976SJY5_THEOR|nr:hypothetical protein MACJ_004179 [Theileria orientalis]